MTLRGNGVQPLTIRVQRSPYHTISDDIDQGLFAGHHFVYVCVCECVLCFMAVTIFSHVALMHGCMGGFGCVCVCV